MEFLLLVATLLVALGIGVGRIVKAVKRGRHLKEVALSLGFDYYQTAPGVIKLSGVRIGRSVVYTFHRLKSGLELLMLLSVETKLPYRLILKRHFETDSPKNVHDAFSCESAEGSAEVEPMLTHPVVETILLTIAEKMNLYSAGQLLIHPSGIQFRIVVTSYIAPGSLDDYSEPVFQLALYLSHPDHLKPVASVEETLAALARAIAEGTDTVNIEPAGTPQEGACGPDAKTAEEEGQKDVALQVDDLLNKVSTAQMTPEECARDIKAHAEHQVDQLVLTLSDYRLRSAARQVLSALSVQAVPTMVKHLADFRVAYEIEGVLKALDDEAMEALVAELDDVDDTETVCSLLEIISERKPEGIVEKIRPLLHSEEHRIRFQAERTLRSLGLSYDQLRRWQDEGT